MASFLLKTEPGTYSFGDLTREKRCVWDGVTNNAALLHLRTMRTGDLVYIYHTGEEKAIVGLAKVVKGAHEDPRRPGLNAKGEAKFAVVELAPVRAARTPVTLATLKGDARFAAFALVRQGRLSAMPVDAATDEVLRAMCGL